MKVLDAATVFGVRPSTDQDLSSETLLRLMDRNGVSEALTCSLQAVQYDAAAGNDETLALCRAHPQLHPVAVVDPRRWPDCLAEVERCAGLGFVSFRLVREMQGWAIATQSVKHLLRAIARTDLPVTVHVPAAGDATVLLEAVGSLDPDVVLAGVSYATLGEALAVLVDEPRMCIEAHRLTCPGQVEVMVEQVGAAGLIFGSWAPLHAQRPSVDMVLGADIGERDKAAILGGNARRLFGLEGGV